jgi:RNA polymerase-binding transcription factor DksA
MTNSPALDAVASDDTDREVRRVAVERLAAERAAQLTGAAQPPVEHEYQATTGLGETDHINVETERHVVAILESHARQAREEVALALARIDDGTYGRCTKCGVTIDAERLLALPRVACCIECQRKSEARA